MNVVNFFFFLNTARRKALVFVWVRLSYFKRHKVKMSTAGGAPAHSARTEPWRSPPNLPVCRYMEDFAVHQTCFFNVMLFLFQMISFLSPCDPKWIKQEQKMNGWMDGYLSVCLCCCIPKAYVLSLFLRWHIRWTFDDTFILFTSKTII